MLRWTRIGSPATVFDFMASLSVSRHARAVVATVRAGAIAMSEERHEVTAATPRSRLLWLLWPTYLVTIGLAYQLAYWPQFGVNILQYASLQGIVALTLAPLFHALLPIVLLIIVIFTFEVVLGSSFVWVVSRIRGAAERLPGPRALGVVLSFSIAIPLAVAWAAVPLYVLASAQRSETSGWALLALLAALTALVMTWRSRIASRDPTSSNPSVPMFTSAALAALPFVSYLVGLDTARLLQASHPEEARSELTRLLRDVPLWCLGDSDEARFVGHVGGFDFIYNPVTGETSVQVAGNLRLRACTRHPEVAVPADS